MGVLAALGIKTGVTMMPLLPYINEDENDIRTLVQKAHDHGATFIVPAFGMTLRDRQRAYYYSQLDAHFPGLRQKYEKRFGDRYSAGISRYRQLKDAFWDACQKHGVSRDMPSYQRAVTGTQLSFLDNGQKNVE
jgi:DNA repair photolyase